MRHEFVLDTIRGDTLGLARKRHFHGRGLNGAEDGPRDTVSIEQFKVYLVFMFEIKSPVTALRNTRNSKQHHQPPKAIPKALLYGPRLIHTWYVVSRYAKAGAAIIRVVMKASLRKEQVDRTTILPPWSDAGLSANTVDPKILTCELSFAYTAPAGTNK